jgi:hypothetical protein
MNLPVLNCSNKINIISKYVISNIANLILEYTHFASILTYKENNNFKLRDITKIIITNKNQLVMLCKSNLIIIFNLNLLDYSVMERYILKKINIPEIYKHKNYVRLYMTTILSLHNNIFVCISVFHENGGTNFIIKLNLNEFELLNSDINFDELSNLIDTNLNISQDSAHLYISVEGMSYMTNTNDENFIVCGFNDIIVNFYDSHTLNKIYTLDCRLNTKELNVSENKNNTVYSILFLNQYMLVMFNYCICVYEMIKSNNYLLKTCIDLPKKVANAFFLVSESITEIIVMLNNNLINIYKLNDSYVGNSFTTSVKNFLYLDKKEFGKSFSSRGWVNKLYVTTGNKPKIIINYGTHIKIYTYNSSLETHMHEKFILIKENILYEQTFMNNKLLLFGDKKIQQVNTKTGKFDKTNIEFLKHTCILGEHDWYPVILYLPNDKIFLSYYGHKDHPNLFEIWT